MASVGPALPRAPEPHRARGVDVVQLGYVACNWDSLVLASALALIMAAAIIVLKVAALAEMYAADEVAVPAFYYFGDRRGMRACVQRALAKKRRGNTGSPAAENFQNGAADGGRHASLAELAEAYLVAPLRGATEQLRLGAALVASANAGVARAHTDARRRAARDAAELGRKISADFGR